MIYIIHRKIKREREAKNIRLPFFYQVRLSDLLPVVRNHFFCRISGW
jgi:hypothetical protein